MINFVMTAVIKFVFLMVFPTLLSPVAFAETATIHSADLYQTKSHHVISAETHASSYTLTSEAELKEPTESESHLSLPYIQNAEISFATSHDKASQNSLDHPLAPVCFLSYLSLFSNSPPTLS